MSENKKFNQPGGALKAPQVPQLPEDVAEDVAEKVQVNQAAPKKIVVIALQELPSFKGKRIPKGSELEILSNQFNGKLMKKK